jgi:hypothetical protein
MSSRCVAAGSKWSSTKSSLSLLEVRERLRPLELELRPLELELRLLELELRPLELELRLEERGLVLRLRAMPSYTSAIPEALHSNAMRRLLDTFALYGVPILAGLLTGGVLLGSASERPAFGARAYGFIAAGGEQYALRVHTRQHLRGSYADFPAPVTVTLSAGGEQLGSASADGAAVVDVVVPLSRALDAGVIDVVVASKRVVLAEATVEVAQPLEPRPVPVVKRSVGESEITVGTPRGFAVPELPEAFEVRVDAPEGDVPQLEVEATGADLETDEEPTRTCKSGRCTYDWDLRMTPRAPTASIDVVAKRAGTELVSWTGPVNVIPGRLWLDPDHESELRIQAAVPRDVAFVSLVSPRGRFWGARVPLTTDDSGVSRGSVPTPELPDGPVTAILSTEPDEPEAAIAIWPLRDGVLDGGVVSLLADGLPAAMMQEEERQAAARRPAYALILAAGLFELFYLWWRARRAKRELDAHVAAHTGGEVSQSVAQSVPLVTLVVLSGALALAFAILAALSAFG